MKTLTFENYQDFIKENLRVKVTNKDNLFYDYVLPVMAIGVGWVSCDVDNDDGTDSFYFEDIEITNEPIKYDIY